MESELRVWSFDLISSIIVKTYRAKTYLWKPDPERVTMRPVFLTHVSQCHLFFTGFTLQSHVTDLFPLISTGTQPGGRGTFLLRPPSVGHRSTSDVITFHLFAYRAALPSKLTAVHMGAPEQSSADENGSWIMSVRVDIAAPRPCATQGYVTADS